MTAAPGLGQQRDRTVAGREVDPARGDAAAQQLHEPGLGALAQRAERRRAIEPDARQARVVRRRAAAAPPPAARTAGGCARRPRAPCARPASSLRVSCALAGSACADVAVAAAVERLRLVAEVAQDRVVPAAAALRPAHELEEEAPLVRDDGLGAAVASPAGGAAGQVVRRRRAGARTPARRRGRRARPPGSTPRSSPEAPGARPRARPPGRCPSRTRSSRPSTSTPPRQERALRGFAQRRVRAPRGTPPPASPCAARRSCSSSAARRVGEYRIATPCAAPGRAQRLRQQRVHLALATRRILHLARAQVQVRPREAAHELRRVGGQASRARISSRTTGVAVAVQARTRAWGRSASSAPSCMYSGRKSWPHSLMQCASSIATSGTEACGAGRGSRGTRAAPARRRRASTRPRRSGAIRAAHLAPVERRGQEGRASTPRACSAATWSFMSATSGEITTVVPGSSSAGSW